MTEGTAGSTWDGGPGGPGGPGGHGGHGGPPPWQSASPGQPYPGQAHPGGPYPPYPGASYPPYPPPKKGLGTGAIVAIVLGALVLVGVVLAALAVPVFLNQRTKSYNAAAKSELRNLATAQEVYVSDVGQYAGSAAELQRAGYYRPSGDASVVLVRARGSRGYCLEATSVRATRVWTYDSEAGGLQRYGARCP